MKEAQQTENISNKNFLREVLPNDFELNRRDKVNRKNVNILINVKEATRVRAFTNAEATSLHNIQQKEKDDFIDFCQRYPYFEGIYYSQLNKRTILNHRNLQALDDIQDIKETKKRIIYQIHSQESFSNFINRNIDFEKNNPNTINIPIIDLDAETVNERLLLKQKTEWLAKSDFTKIAVIFRGRIAFSRSWNLALPRFTEEDKEIYVFEVPTRKDGGFSPLIYPIMMGANKVCHKRNIIGWGSGSSFIERTWELINYPSISNGLADYNGQNRIQFIKSDGRKTAINPFSKWDRIVQANEFCRTDLNVPDLRQVIYLKKAFSHFF